MPLMAAVRSFFVIDGFDVFVLDLPEDFGEEPQLIERQRR